MSLGMNLEIAISYYNIFCSQRILIQRYVFVKLWVIFKQKSNYYFSLLIYSAKNILSLYRQSMKGSHVLVLVCIITEKQVFSKF